MTINEYLNGVPNMVSSDGTSLRDTMKDAVSIWSNDACRGYCIDAMQQAGFSREQILKVVSELRWSFDGLSIEQAEKTYLKF